MSDPLQENPPENTAIYLDNISVVYRFPTEKIASIKEFAIKTLLRQVEYRQFKALSGIHLEVNRGEIFGVIGRNGAGKSTLLKVISRVLYPTTGRVWIRGQVAPLLELGAGFHPELTGVENIFLNGTLLGHDRKEIIEKIDEIIAFSEIGEFINSPIRTYSSGMIARLGFSVATAWIPDILLLDEILSVGDQAFQEKCRVRMRSMMQSGSTILLVTHASESIRLLCSRALLLDHGRILGIGTGDEISQMYTAFLQGN